jgi:hypothetical protein
MLYFGHCLGYLTLPMRWLVKLIPVPGRAPFLAVLLHGDQGGRYRRLVNTSEDELVSKYGFSYAEVHDALHGLEQAGLIRIEKYGKKNLEITIADGEGRLR